MRCFFTISLLGSLSGNPKWDRYSKAQTYRNRRTAQRYFKMPTFVVGVISAAMDMR